MLSTLASDLELDTLTVEQDDRVLLVRFCDPPHNFMTVRMQKDLDILTAAVDADTSVGAVVLTGGVLKPFVQTPLVKLVLWVTTGALPPVIRERLCLNWTGLDELRYRLHLKALHATIRAILAHLQYFPLAREQRWHYQRTGIVAPIPLPTQNSHQ